MGWDYPRFEVLEGSSSPVIDFDHAGLDGNKYGFEGGMALKVEGAYHLFSAEMAGDPFWIRMRLAHWTSSDAREWTRVSTLFESKGVNSCDDARSSVWAPMPIYNAKEGRWNLFYVSYRGPRPREVQAQHMDGKIWRAVSEAAGRGGIGGPYRDVEVVLCQGADSEAWEGQQGPDSIFPYQVGEKWYALYGGHNYDPISPWLVGLAAAPELAGPWRRCPESSPAAMEREFIENPVVTRLGDGRYVAVYDSAAEVPAATAGALYIPDARNIGYSFSVDGVDWAPGRRIAVRDGGPGDWASDMRTPLGLIDEGKNVFTVLYTAERKGRKFWSVGMARVRMVG